jgi:mannose-6-phosphate isomerase-like protein (cupin superfamily)
MITSSGRVVLQGLSGGFSPADHGNFIPFFPGVEILPLYGLDAAGRPLDPSQPSAALLRYAPGASVPPHRHRGYEHILIVSGSQEDDQGTYQSGTFVMSPPGTEHAVASAQGCLVLAIWAQSVEVIHD